MQLPLFQETHEADTEALNYCLASDIVAVDIETDTRWSGRGSRLDYGLSYVADVTVIVLAWLENSGIATTVLSAPFNHTICEFLKTLFNSSRLLVAHNAVFDLRQLSKLTTDPPTNMGYAVNGTTVTSSC